MTMAMRLRLVMLVALAACGGDEKPRFSGPAFTTDPPPPARA